MYINYSDYELLYLIKEGNELAKAYLYKKYASLIKKVYFENDYKYMGCQDFLQEGFLILESAIYSYNMEYTHSFYNYFMICLKRRWLRLYNQNGAQLKEEKVNYNVLSSPKVMDYLTLKIIDDEFKNEDEISKEILRKCILEKESLKKFCLDKDLDYRKTHYLYCKIRLKLENILTK